MNNPELAEDLSKRSLKIVGQVQGIERMIGENKYCIDVINQIHAARRALDKMALMLIEDHVRTCVKKALTEKKNAQPIIEELTKAMDRLFRK